mgnify:CR=1 FL=1
MTFFTEQEIEKFRTMTQQEAEDYVWRFLFNRNMQELLSLKDLSNTLYQEDSVYNGGTIRYIPKANWDWVWEEKFLYNMSKLDVDKREEEEEEDIGEPGGLNYLFGIPLSKCVIVD